MFLVPFPDSLVLSIGMIYLGKCCCIWVNSDLALWWSLLRQSLNTSRSSSGLVWCFCNKFLFVIRWGFHLMMPSLLLQGFHDSSFSFHQLKGFSSWQAWVDSVGFWVKAVFCLSQTEDLGILLSTLYTSTVTTIVQWAIKDKSLFCYQLV
jgi:hypothetical protein